ncbi:MAG: serine/threonine-protein phosphatase [Sphingomonadales bacterium]|nr:serine/threonine-protein phosphatase [Sphingomonadales bacterium]
MLQFRHASRASQGKRTYQEDASAVWQPDSGAGSRDGGIALVAVLADGMGGHAGGALASGTVCAAFLTALRARDGSVGERLKFALTEANSAIADAVVGNPGLTGMGATLVGVAFAADGAEWVSVGDSPLYLVRRGEIARLNEDHSLAPMLDRLVADGRLSPEQAKIDPRRHYLRSAVSGEELDLIDVSRRPLMLEAGDVIVIASDGIHTLGDEAIARLVAQNASYGVDAIAAALIETVDRAADAMQDNTTVIVIGVDDSVTL